MPSDDLIFDAWTSLSFKRALGSKTQPGVSLIAPTWVGHHDRRLRAYTILQAYMENSSRLLLQTDSEDEKQNHREYGDAALIVTRLVGALLGEDQVITVEGADEYDPNDPDNSGEDSKAAFDLQAWLQEWAQAERLPLKVLETERNAIGMGDGVYTLGWNVDKGRPRLRVFDPGFYFPVIDDGNEDDYPGTVHIAWELPEEDQQGVRSLRKKVRRITWSLQPIPGGGTRRHPWNDQASKLTCLMSDGTWTFENGGRQTVEDFSEGAVEWATYTAPDGTEREWKDVDLQIDFVPVVHVPNTVAIVNHFGKSSLASVLQILDDLANADTDLQASSATTGTPPIGLSGATLGTVRPKYKAGEVWELGENGKLDMLDTSRALDALLKYTEHLLKRLSVNSRIPEAVLGRVNPSEIPSGVALALSFGPLESMVKEMRLVRDEKYPLLFKFVHRIALAGRAADVPQVYYPTSLEFGSFLPNDLDGVIKQITALLTAKAISLETAVFMLINAGLPIDDAAEEVIQIQSRDFVGAQVLLDVTGDENAVSDYLGIEFTSTLPEAPPVVLPPLQPPPPPNDDLAP